MEIGRGHALLLILILVGIKRNIINPRGTTIIRVGGVGIAGSALYAWVMNHQGHRPCTTTNTMGLGSVLFRSNQKSGGRDLSFELIL